MYSLLVRVGTKMSNRFYVDNALNRRLGRVGMPIGTHVHRRGDPIPRADLQVGAHVHRLIDPPPPAPSSRVHVDNPINRHLGRVGLPVGEHVHRRGDPIPRADHAMNLHVGAHVHRHIDPPPPAPSSRVHVDNPMNRHLGRVGLPVGEHVHRHGEPIPRADQATTQHVGTHVHRRIDPLPPAPSSRVHVDNAMNRHLGRVGLPVGEHVHRHGDPIPNRVDNSTNQQVRERHRHSNPVPRTRSRAEASNLGDLSRTIGALTRNIRERIGTIHHGVRISVASALSPPEVSTNDEERQSDRNRNGQDNRAQGDHLRASSESASSNRLRRQRDTSNNNQATTTSAPSVSRQHNDPRADPTNSVQDSPSHVSQQTSGIPRPGPVTEERTQTLENSDEAAPQSMQRLPSGNPVPQSSHPPVRKASPPPVRQSPPHATSASSTATEEQDSAQLTVNSAQEVTGVSEVCTNNREGKTRMSVYGIKFTGLSVCLHSYMCT